MTPLPTISSPLYLSDFKTKTLIYLRTYISIFFTREKSLKGKIYTWILSVHQKGLVGVVVRHLVEMIFLCFFTDNLLKKLCPRKFQLEIISYWTFSLGTILLDFFHWEFFHWVGVYVRHLIDNTRLESLFLPTLVVCYSWISHHSKSFFRHLFDVALYVPDDVF